MTRPLLAKCLAASQALLADGVADPGAAVERCALAVGLRCLRQSGFERRLVGLALMTDTLAAAAAAEVKVRPDNAARLVGGGGFGGTAAAAYRSMAPATAANPVGRLPWEQSNYDDDEDIYGPSGLLPPRRQESAWQPDEEWMPRGAVRSAEVAAWLREAGVLPLLLGECLHEELLRRAEPLLGALIEHGALEADELDALWDATLNNHASVRAALASVLGAVAPRLPSALVLRLLTLAEELPAKRAEETLLRSLLQICRAQPAAAAERFALTLWRLCAEPAAPAAAMVTLAELLCPPADAGDSVLDSASALRRRFLFVCLRCLHDGTRVLAALRQLRTLLPRLTHTELNAPAAPLSPGPWDSAGASSDEALLEEGESFAAAVLRHSIAEALRFAAAASAPPAVASTASAAATSGAVAVDTGPPQGAELVSAVEERLKFVHFVLRGTRLVLSHEDAASLWRA